ncbi:hypothetical protein GF362_07675 [Candidatus Dojkabacteria bacterium]|nr:hypothetical protein [Candidatus Dojkabacteria bacterium]
MFKKGELVIYPGHGAGKIKKTFKQKFNDEMKKYYKIAFFDADIELSLPVENAEHLGLRKPTTKKDLKTMLKSINKKTRYTKKIEDGLQDKMKKAIHNGETDLIIKNLKRLKTVRKKRKKEGKSFKTTNSRLISRAIEFLKSEVSLVLGDKYVERFDLNQESALYG